MLEGTTGRRRLSHGFAELEMMLFTRPTRQGIAHVAIGEHSLPGRPCARRGSCNPQGLSVAHQNEFSSRMPHGIVVFHHPAPRH